MSKRRPGLTPAGLLVAAALFLLLHPLACRKPPPLIEVPDGEPVAEPDSGPDAGPPEDAGDGGYHGDAGCLVNVNDGGGVLVPPGSWLNLILGSCTICDPTINPDGYTVFDSGEPCFGYGFNMQVGGQQTVPFEGVCTFERPPFGSCGGGRAGDYCEVSHGFGCMGSVCSDQGYCEVVQNLGWFTECGVVDSLSANACADGPCCLDAGFEVGWCCGLIDGGISTCFPEGTPCLKSSDCCPPLSCTGKLGTLPGGSGSSVGRCQ